MQEDLDLKSIIWIWRNDHLTILSCWVELNHHSQLFFALFRDDAIFFLQIKHVSKIGRLMWSLVKETIKRFCAKFQVWILFLCSPHARRAVSFLDLHSGPKVASSHTKINENFANYFIKTKAQNQVLYISGKYKCKVLVSYGGKIKGKCVATLQRQSSLESSCSCLDLCACSLLAYKMHFVVGLCAAVHSAYFVDHLN